MVPTAFRIDVLLMILTEIFSSLARSIKSVWVVAPIGSPITRKATSSFLAGRIILSDCCSTNSLSAIIIFLPYNSSNFSMEQLSLEV